MYGEKDDIYYSVRKGFEKDYPELIKYFDNWNMTDEQLGTLMTMINESNDPEQAAEKWIKKNKKLVNTWMKK